MIQAVVGKKFPKDSFRESLEDGVLLCEWVVSPSTSIHCNDLILLDRLMNRVIPGSIRRINKSKSPIAYLVSRSELNGHWRGIVVTNPYPSLCTVTTFSCPLRLINYTIVPFIDYLQCIYCFDFLLLPKQTLYSTGQHSAVSKKVSGSGYERGSTLWYHGSSGNQNQSESGVCHDRTCLSESSLIIFITESSGMNLTDGLEV